ncbi:MAG TPA: hypothetical protein VJ891_09435, partial [Casimicrobiaceae bacterium]|nr:hypothetical protein [Casimicrobiaceae bacterium]
MMQQLVDLGFVERRTDEAGQEGYQVTAEGLAQYGEELASLGLPPNATAEQVLGAREQQESAAIAE